MEEGVGSGANEAKPGHGDGRRRVRARKVARAVSSDDAPAKVTPSLSTFDGSLFSGVHSSAVGSKAEALALLDELERKRAADEEPSVVDVDLLNLSSSKRRKVLHPAWNIDALSSAELSAEPVRTSAESSEPHQSWDERPDRPPTPPPPMDPVMTNHRHSRMTSTILQEYSNAIGSLQHMERPLSATDIPDLLVSDSGNVAVESNELTVKVRSSDRILRFTVKKSDTIAKLVSLYASHLNIPSHHVSLWKGEQALPLNKTIASAGLLLTDILDSTVADPNSDESADRELMKENMIKLKVQDKRKSRSFTIGKAQTFNDLLSEYCKATGSQPSDVRLAFDGEPLDLSQTPVDLDMEDDEIIDAAST